MRSLELSAGRLRLDGTDQVLLCASVFPYRLPPATWAHRLDLVAASGYAMVDLYVPWGFHEMREGEIDLASPERDVARFLDLCVERNLLVMARPGPYICSETDGGALPAWLHGERAGRGGLRLRSTDPGYLAAVDSWFAAIMPVLAAHEVSAGGPVALVQIENELDFLDCPEAPAYMAHLRERARAHGITVPVIACAGQGDLRGATGDADDVVPTVNLYPDDRAPDFDEEARYYYDLLGRRDAPLMVTETNRIHRTLRREILAGARLVAPYLQVSGYNHLFAPSTGNWGDPGSLMTHDYDFDGYVSRDGRRRPEYAEAVRLTRTLAAWGERLATARPIPISEAPIRAMDGRQLAGGALALERGGWIVGPAELTGLAASAVLGAERDDRSPLVGTVAPWACPFWSVDVPLAPWGRSGSLCASAELTACAAFDGILDLSFEGGAEARVTITVPGTAGECSRLELGQGEEGELEAPEGLIRARLVPPVEVGADPEGAGHAAALAVAPVAWPSGADAAACVEDGRSGSPERSGVQGRAASQDQAGAEAREHAETYTRGAVPSFEQLGMSDGRLHATTVLPEGVRRIVITHAGDLVRVRVDGRDLGVAVPYGSTIAHVVDPACAHDLSIDAELWGHSNFDDARRPGMRIGSGRGVGTVLAVTGETDVSALWVMEAVPSADRREGVDRTRCARSLPALRTLGGWSSTVLGGSATYARLLPSDTRALEFIGLAVPVEVRVGDRPPLLVSPESPVIAVPHRGDDVKVEIRAPHVTDGFCRGARALRGFVPDAWTVTARPQADVVAGIAAAGSRPARSADPVASDLPIEVGPGTARLVAAHAAPAPGHGVLLRLAGENVQVTAVHAGRLVSRHVFGGTVTSGGDPALAWVPTSWIDAASGAGSIAPTTHPADVRIDLLVEPLSADGGRLTRAVWTDALT